MSHIKILVSSTTNAMANRPTPYSIALSALIALHCEEDSPLYGSDGDNNKKNDTSTTQVDALLQKLLLEGGGDNSNGDWSKFHAPHVSLLVDELKSAAGRNIAMKFSDWLKVAASSVDALTDLMTTLKWAVQQGTVDSTSANGMLIRSIVLGFDQLSFESTAQLWNDFHYQVESLDEANAAPASLEHQQQQGGDNDDDDDDSMEMMDLETDPLTTFAAGSSSALSAPPHHQQWCLSPAQMENSLRQECLSMLRSGGGGGAAAAASSNEHCSFEDIQLKLHRVLEHNPEIPSAHFLRFLHSWMTGERIGAVEALHQYFDYALLQEPKNQQPEILQFAAILSAALHDNNGDQALSLAATEEAVRVAQQSQDAACVAFALGWLFANEHKNHAGNGRNGDNQELIRRCVQRSMEKDLRTLFAGANLTLTRHSLSGTLRNRETLPHVAWSYLNDASGDAPTAESTNRWDRPTHMTHIDSGDQALEILARQRLVASGVWEAFGQTVLSGLSCRTALHCSQAHQILTEDVATAIQNISRVSLFGSSSYLDKAPQFLSWVLIDDMDSSLADRDVKPKAVGNKCIYAATLQSIIRLREKFNLRVEGIFLHDIALVLHEWAVRRGDFVHAEALGRAMQSHLHPRIPNYSEVAVDIYFQQCLLLSRQERWEEAKTLAKKMIEKCGKEGLQTHRARLLLQLAMIQLESCQQQFTNALPSLLECLTITDMFQMDNLHAAALSVLAQVHLRMHKPKRSIAMLRAALPSLLQHGHIWLQGEAYLTLSKCHLQRAKRYKHENPATEAKTVTKILRSATKDLKRSETLFRLCHDCHRLQEVSYLQARTFSSLPNCQNQRDRASQVFVRTSKYLAKSNRPVADGFMNSLSNLSGLENLAARPVPC